MRGYARTFRCRLSVETLPTKFSLTNSVHVQSYELHDEVDGQFDICVGKSATIRVWLYGLVVNKRAATTKEPYQVFWIGSKPCHSGKDINPQWVCVHILRRHIEGTETGTDQEWMDVGRIKGFRIEDYKPRPKPPRTEPPVTRPSARPLRPKPATPAPEVTKQKHKSHPKPAPRPKPASATKKHAADKSESSSSSSSESSSSSSSESSSSSSSESSDAESRSEEFGESDTSDGTGEQQHRMHHVVEEAIACLESMDGGKPPREKLFENMSRKLQNMADSLAIEYSNKTYQTVVSETLSELSSYEGKEAPQLPHSEEFLAGLRKYGFCLTPRMWQKERIVCICIAILDPRLNFRSILQKDGTNEEQPKSFRGMALLDARVERVFYKRLQEYGFANPIFHPERLQSFSSVVINGGGSWRQSSNWFFLKQFRFQNDKDVVPFMICIKDAPGVLEAGGIYVATTERKQGLPVYAQVSRLEYKGKIPGCKPFVKCMQPAVQKRIQKQTIDTAGTRIEACSPRVLVALEHRSWGIQLAPGYGTSTFIMKFETGEPQSGGGIFDLITNPTCFKRLDWGTGEVVMQPCKLSITMEAVAARDCLTEAALKHGHHFSFGTKKGVSTDRLAMSRMEDSKFKAKPLRPQGFHWDGPQAFNFGVFDMVGNLRPEAKGCKHQRRGPWCRMPHGTLDTFVAAQNNILLESFSALFAMLRGTYIETRSSQRGQSLKVRAGLGRAVLFTFSWKHRGKGDRDDSDSSADYNDDALPDIHARPHFYVYSTDLRKLPTVDVETSLEFMSICANDSAGATADAASRLQVLDCLQTFTPESADGHKPRGKELSDVHEFFESKEQLDQYVKLMLEFQSRRKVQEEFAVRQLVDNWCIVLTRTGSCCTIKLVSANPSDKVDVEVTKVLFDKRIPSFLGRDRRIYELGRPAKLVEIPAHTADFSDDLKDELTKVLLLPVQQAMENLMVDWHEANLVQLLRLFDMRTVNDWTLSKREPGYFKARGSPMVPGVTIEFKNRMLERTFYDDEADQIIARLYVNATTSQHVMLVTAAQKRKRDQPKRAAAARGKRSSAQALLNVKYVSKISRTDTATGSKAKQIDSGDSEIAMGEWPMNQLVFVKDAGRAGHVVGHGRKQKSYEVLTYRIRMDDELLDQGTPSTVTVEKDQVYKLIRNSQTPWPSRALACQTRVRGVDGFDDMDSKKKGFGRIVGVCVDNDALPVYYEVYIDDGSVFFFNVCKVHVSRR